ncbi:MAG: hypothetical protein ING75_10050 [Rhodocyclaceae bacterium]|nr:hypothetical protein [Rhodocyclaceae bacterium]
MLSEIDDLTESPRLADLNRRYMASVTSEERLKNEEFFRGIVTGDDDERMLLKMAKELRLVLPIYLNDSGYAGGN